jgi:1-acyl-sn-glycerol-3-phosphate acyltransferase
MHTSVTPIRASPRSARVYRLLVRLGVPLRWWLRLEASGRELLPPHGTGLLIVSNHDSMLDPLAVADTLVRAGRPVRFLAMDRLWRLPPVAAVLNGIQQIPIRRGTGDVAALRLAIGALAEGEAICIFPEGHLSRGRTLRPRRGVSRIIEASPDAQVVLAAVSGAPDMVRRFPRRPRVRVELFRPAGPTRRSGEDHAALAARLLNEIRARVPPVAAGRPRRASAQAAPGAQRLASP